MENKSLIKIFFGKETEIIKEDIEKKILGNFKESAFIDYKRLDGRNSLTKQEITRSEAKNLIISGIVAFLNKINAEGGILSLGINAPDKIPTDIIGVEDKIIKDDSTLRNWILDGISSIPAFLEFPSIEIETVSIENTKKVYFIEIHPKDLNVHYFNKFDGAAYARQIDTTRKLSLEESVRIIDTKKTARLFADLELIESRIDDDFVIYKMKIVFNNTGNKPATNVLGMFLFDYTKKENKKENIEVEFFDTHNITETSIINTCSKSFQQNFNQLFYPGRPVVVGFFTVRFLRAAPIQLILEIDEQYSRSKQAFVFTEVEFNKLSKNFSLYH